MFFLKFLDIIRHLRDMIQTRNETRTHANTVVRGNHLVMIESRADANSSPSVTTLRGGGRGRRDRVRGEITFMWLLNEGDVFIGDLSDGLADTACWLV